MLFERNIKQSEELYVFGGKVVIVTGTSTYSVSFHP